GPSSAPASSSGPTPDIPSPYRRQNLLSSHVVVSFPDDKGLTWAPGGTVVPTPPATGVKRWWPVVNVEPGGAVDVVYYESQEMPTATNTICNISLGGGVRRRGTANSLVNTFWAQSLDGGTTFQ